MRTEITAAEQPEQAAVAVVVTDQVDADATECCVTCTTTTHPGWCSSPRRSTPRPCSTHPRPVLESCSSERTRARTRWFDDHPGRLGHGEVEAEQFAGLQRRNRPRVVSDIGQCHTKCTGNDIGNAYAGLRVRERHALIGEHGREPGLLDLAAPVWRAQRSQRLWAP